MELSEQQLQELRDRKRVHYRQWALDGAIRLRPGVQRLLAALHDRGIDQWIVTSSGRASVDALFGGQQELKSMFAGIVTADDVSQENRLRMGTEKPSDAVESPDSILAVEDSEAGFQAAQAAGLQCLLTPSPWDAGLTQLFGQASAVFDHLGMTVG